MRSQKLIRNVIPPTCLRGPVGAVHGADVEGEGLEGEVHVQGLLCQQTAAVSEFYFPHSVAKYVAVGKIGKDQVLDYQARKGMPLSVLERWLGPNLNYEPQ